jgi:predicted DNA-binding protein (MmcQ/YjbR family)
MNKKYWVSILLDDTLSDEAIQPLIRGSYESVS